MSERKILIAPSILSADFRKLEAEVKAVEDAGADRIHCDIMDGHFVPNITFGPLVVEVVRRCVTIPLDVHLMIEHPLQYIPQFARAGADSITVHAESDDCVGEMISMIKEQRGPKVGVTVNPDKPVGLLMPFLGEADQALIMTVFAGFGGQTFIPQTMTKVRAVRDAAVERGLNVDIEVDGGINGETSAVCAGNGANIFVAGNYIFASDDYAGRIRSVREGALRGRAAPASS